MRRHDAKISRLLGTILCLAVLGTGCTAGVVIDTGADSSSETTETGTSSTNANSVGNDLVTLAVSAYDSGAALLSVSPLPSESNAIIFDEEFSRYDLSLEAGSACSSASVPTTTANTSTISGATSGSCAVTITGSGTTRSMRANCTNYDQGNSVVLNGLLGLNVTETDADADGAPASQTFIQGCESLTATVGGTTCTVLCNQTESRDNTTVTVSAGTLSVCGSCFNATGSVTVGSDARQDCNDSDATINPSAAEVCTDSTDNDCDGSIDCADSGCDGSSCGANGLTCASSICSCPGGEVTETTCTDSSDNDCDGSTDCSDSNCNGQTCETIGADTLTCKDSFCSCPSGQIACSSTGGTCEIPCDGIETCTSPKNTSILSDEDTLLCLGSAPAFDDCTLSPGTMACVDGSNSGNCVTACDGNQECTDGSDESLDTCDP
jgi:hypothetical protein